MGTLLRHLHLKLHPLSNHHVVVIHQLGDGHRGLCTCKEFDHLYGSRDWRDASLEEGRRTFDKDLSEALVISNHALIGSVISQAGPVDGERSDISICLNDVPLKMTGRRFIRAAPFLRIQ